MTKFIIIVSVYDQEDTQAYPLGGIFDTEKQAKEYIRQHVYDVIDSHWTKGRRNTEEGYEAEYTVAGGFVAQDMYSGQSLEIEIREVPVMSEEFPVAVLMREDLEFKGFKAKDLNDDTMEVIASKMGDYMLDDIGYWDALVASAEWHGIERKDEEE